MARARVRRLGVSSCSGSRRTRTNASGGRPTSSWSQPGRIPRRSRDRCRPPKCSRAHGRRGARSSCSTSRATARARASPRRSRRAAARSRSSRSALRPRALTYSTVGVLALRRLAELGVHLIEGHRLVAVEDGAVHLARIYDGTPLVLATRDRPRLAAHTGRQARRRTAGEGDPVRAVGDARAPRLVEDAIADGYAAGLAL